MATCQLLSLGQRDESLEPTVGTLGAGAANQLSPSRHNISYSACRTPWLHGYYTQHDQPPTTCVLRQTMQSVQLSDDHTRSSGHKSTRRWGTKTWGNINIWTCQVTGIGVKNTYRLLCPITGLLWTYISLPCCAQPSSVACLQEASTRVLSKLSSPVVRAPCHSILRENDIHSNSTSKTLKSMFTKSLSARWDTSPSQQLFSTLVAKLPRGSNQQWSFIESRKLQTNWAPTDSDIEQMTSLDKKIYSIQVYIIKGKMGVVKNSRLHFPHL